MGLIIGRGVKDYFLSPVIRHIIALDVPRSDCAQNPLPKMRTFRIIATYGIVVFLANACATADELHKWKSTNGHEVDAAFQSYDAESDVVVLLIPRSVPLSSLDAKSRELAKSLANQSAVVSPPSDSNPAASERSNGVPIWGYTGEASFPADFHGMKMFTQQGVPAYGIKDFKWFELPNESKIDASLVEKYGVKQLPAKTEVVAIDRRRHPKSNSWVFQVQLGPDQLWVPGDSLGATPDSLQTAVKRASAEGPSQYPTLTGPVAGDTKYAYSIYSQPILVFKSGAKLVSHWSAGWPPNPTPQERSRLGARTLTPNTTVKIISKYQSGLDLPAFLIEVLDGNLTGEHVHIHADDLCDAPQ